METPRVLLLGKLEVLHEERLKALLMEQTWESLRMEPHQKTCRSQDKEWTNQPRLRKSQTT